MKCLAQEVFFFYLFNYSFSPISSLFLELILVMLSVLNLSSKSLSLSVFFSLFVLLALCFEILLPLDVPGQYMIIFILLLDNYVLGAYYVQDSVAGIGCQQHISSVYKRESSCS